MQRRCCFLRCLFANYSVIQLQFFLLLSVFALEWLSLVYIGKHSSFSKLGRYVSTDEEFLRSFDVYWNSSDQAKLAMTKWLSDPNQPGQIRQQLPLFSKATELNSLCVGILSKRRLTVGPDQQRNYLTQTLMSMLTRIRLKHQESVEIHLFNVDASPLDHAEFEELKKFVNHEYVNARLVYKFDAVTLKEIYERPKLKEMADYAIVLNRLQQIDNCEYFLTLEDDCIAAFNWYESVLDSLEEISSSYLFSGNWFAIKYFTSFRTFDWLIHIKTDLFYAFVSLVFSAIHFHLFKWLIMKRFQEIMMINQHELIKSNRLNMNSEYILFGNKRIRFRTLIVVCVCLQTFSMCFWYYSNHVRPLGDGLKLFSQGFNNVAILYPRRVVLKLAKFFEQQLNLFVEKNGYLPKDIAVKEFIRENDLYEFIYEPSLFQHAGLHSSLGYRSLKEINHYQFEPFQSYSFKDHGKEIRFDPNYWNDDEE